MMDSKRMKGPWLIKVIRRLPQQLCSLSIPHKNTPTQRKTHNQWTYWQLLPFYGRQSLFGYPRYRSNEKIKAPGEMGYREYENRARNQETWCSSVLTSVRAINQKCKCPQTTPLSNLIFASNYFQGKNRLPMLRKSKWIKTPRNEKKSAHLCTHSNVTSS